MVKIIYLLKMLQIAADTLNKHDGVQPAVWLYEYLDDYNVQQNNISR